MMYTIPLNTPELKSLFQTMPCTDGTHMCNAPPKHPKPGTLTNLKRGQLGCTYPDKCVLVSYISDQYAVIHATNPLDSRFTMWPPTTKSQDVLTRARQIAEAQKWKLTERKEETEESDSEEEDGGVGVVAKTTTKVNLATDSRRLKPQMPPTNTTA